MKVLLSIKPEFVEKIFAGTKKYEFRKSLFKKSGVKYVVIYASAPIKRVVGEFEIDDIDLFIKFFIGGQMAIMNCNEEELDNKISFLRKMLIALKK